MATIKNFGFMWERDKVVWGRPGRGGTSSLEGVMVGNQKRRVQFDEQMGVRQVLTAYNRHHWPHKELRHRRFLS
jgi:hypothetical protein